MTVCELYFKMKVSLVFVFLFGLTTVGILQYVFTTVLMARQDSCGQITRARRNSIHIRTQSRARVRAFKTRVARDAPIWGAPGASDG